MGSPNCEILQEWVMFSNFCRVVCLCLSTVGNAGVSATFQTIACVGLCTGEPNHREKINTAGRVGGGSRTNLGSLQLTGKCENAVSKSRLKI